MSFRIQKPKDAIRIKDDFAFCRKTIVLAATALIIEVIVVFITIQHIH